MQPTKIYTNGLVGPDDPRWAQNSYFIKFYHYSITLSSHRKAVYDLTDFIVLYLKIYIVTYVGFWYNHLGN